MNGVVALNELLELAKRSKRECFLFKVYFYMAYDFVRCFFLVTHCRDLVLMTGGRSGFVLVFLWVASMCW